MSNPNRNRNGKGKSTRTGNRNRNRNTRVRRRSNVSFEVLEPRQLLAADIAVNWQDLNDQPLVGETVEVSLTVANSSAEVGFGPFVDVVIPGSAVQGDGLSYVTDSATLLDMGLEETVVEFDSNGEAIHPLAKDGDGHPIVVHGATGDQLVVFELPLGSFTPDQPAMQIDLQLTVDHSAEVGTPLTLAANGGFRFGSDALDNTQTDPVIFGDVTTLDIVPELIRTHVEYLGPESETATGENFVQSYRVSFDVVDQVEIEDLTIKTQLSANQTFVALREPTFDGLSVSISTPNSDQVAAANNTIVWRAQQWVGAEGVDGSFIIDFYVPKTDNSGDFVIDPLTAIDGASTIEVSTHGRWVRQMATDTTPAEIVSISTTPVTHQLQGEFLAVQQSVKTVGDAKTRGLSPGDTLEYTVSFQVSDYAVIDDLLVELTVPDGQSLLANRNATLVLSGIELQNDQTGPFSFQLQPAAHWQPGDQVYQASIADLLQSHGSRTRIHGGLTADGTGQAVTGSIRYTTSVNDQFLGAVASGDASVDEGDFFNSNVTITAANIDPATGQRSGYLTADTSGTVQQLATSDIKTSVYSINGQRNPTDLRVTADDLVTYRMTRSVRSGDIENLVLSQFLPLPLFSIEELQWGAGENGLSTANRLEFGPQDTLHGALGSRPRIQIDSVNNSFRLDYGSFDRTDNETLTIDLLVTVQVEDRPFADGLWLSSLANAQQGSSNAGDYVSNALADVQYTRPVLEIAKNAVGSDNPSALLTQTGDRGTDIQHVDANDVVQFEIEIVNTGQSAGGAHDVWIKDVLPDGFEIPEGGLNLKIVDGSGNTVAYREAAGAITGAADRSADEGLFADGIELLSPIGSAVGDSFSGGENRITISYELQVSRSAEANSVLGAGAHIVHYSAVSGGQNHVTSPLQDDAIARLADASITHKIVGTDQSHTPNKDVVIGETVTYSVEVAIPEGQMNQASLQLRAPRGLAFNQVLSVTIPQAIQLDGLDSDGLLAGAVISDVGSNIRNGGRILTVDVGDLVNNDVDNDRVETIEVIYTATITGDPNNDAGDNRRSTAVWSHRSGSQAKTSNAVKIVEPKLSVNASWSTPSVDASDTVTIRLDIIPESILGATAFDVNLEDRVPQGTVYVPGSLRWVDGFQPNRIDDGDSLTAHWNSIATDQVSTLEYDVVVDRTVHAGSQFSNHATITWSSLAGEPGQISEFNELTYERTGDTNAIGGEANDYLDSGQAVVAVSPVDVSLVLIGTSHDNTDGHDVTLGERATFEVTLTVPEGAHGVSLTGLNIGNEAAILPETFTLVSIGENLELQHGEIGSAVKLDDTGKLKFDFGTVTNSPDNQSSGADTIVLHLTGLVPDELLNRSGGVVTVGAEVDFDFGVSRSEVGLDIVEPQLEIQQTVSKTNVDAGDRVDVAVVIQHQNTDRYGAFEVDFQKTLLGSGLTLVPGSLFVMGGHIVSGGDSDSQAIRIVADSFSISDEIGIAYQVAVNQDVRPGTEIHLTPTLTYLSVDSSDARPYATSTTTVLRVSEGTIAGQVLLDVNQDGTEQIGDRGIGGVAILLTGTDHLGQTVTRSTQTLATGLFEFQGLRPGTYSLIETQPDGNSDGLDLTADRAAVVGNDRIDNIVLPVGQSTFSGAHRFTESPLTWIEGTVFVDANEDGILGQDEDGIAGVLIGLNGVDENGQSIERTVTTNDRGYYVFDYLSPGTYSISQGITPGYLDAAEQLGSQGGEVGDDFFEQVQISAGAPGKMYNFGEYAPASIQGQIYVDYDRDGVLDRRDGLVGGVDVRLDGINDLGETISVELRTDADGEYVFSGLRPGDYQISSQSLAPLNSFVSNVGNYQDQFSSLISNGRSIENGFESISIPAGVAAVAYNIGHVDDSYMPTILGSSFQQQHLIYGSSQEDQFVVNVSTDEAQVTIGESVYTFDADQTRSIRLLGSFGNDSLVFTGSQDKETIDLRRHSARITGTWFETLVYGVEDIQFVGGGNEDLARFYDTHGDDNFSASPFAGQMTGRDYQNSVDGVHRIYAYMSQGHDVAHLMGATHQRDNFRAAPTEAKLYGDEFYLYVRDADVVSAQATDLADRAYLFGSQADDSFYSADDYQTLQSSHYLIATHGYSTVVANADQGGQDVATMMGSAGDDRLISRPTEATLYAGGRKIVAQDFQAVEVRSNGGADDARVYDSHYDDLFSVNANHAFIRNEINHTTMLGFQRISAYMDAGGADVASLTGGDGVDLFKASPTQWTLSGGGRELRGRGFTTVVATGQSNDKAYLYDSAYDDTLHLTETHATLSGQRFSNSVRGFGKVNSEASLGDDRVVFVDSAARSTIRMNQQKTTIFGARHSYNATGFDAVDAFFADLDGRDNLDLDGRIDFDIAETDVDFGQFKLSLFWNDDLDDQKRKIKVKQAFSR